MHNLYLLDRQIIAFFGRSSPAEKTAVGEHMVSISVHSCLRRNQQRTSDETVGWIMQVCVCIPLWQELPVICYGGTVWGHFMSFTGPPSRFSFRCCHSGTAIQASGTVAGIYGIRRLQVKRSGRLGLGPSSRLTVADHRGPDAVSPQKCTRSPLKTGDLERFRPESALGPLQKCET